MSLSVRLSRSDPTPLEMGSLANIIGYVLAAVRFFFDTAIEPDSSPKYCSVAYCIIYKLSVLRNKISRNGKYCRPAIIMHV